MHEAGRRCGKVLAFHKVDPPSILRPPSFYIYWMGVTYLMLIIRAFMSDPLLSYVTYSFAY